MDDATRGLPPSANQRVQRQVSSGVSSSLFSAPAAAAATSAGLAPVGEVFGCRVMNFGWAGAGCGWYAGATLAPVRTPILTSGRGGRYSAFAPYARAFEAGWYGAVERMLTEAKALGAEGVVGVTVERKLLDARVWEFAALGTAVRSTDPVLAPRPEPGVVWSSNFSTEDTAAAVLSGFLPQEIVLGFSVSTKHEDWQLQNQRSSWINQEVEAMSELIGAAREEARTRMKARATRTHGNGAHIVVTQMGLHEFETQCGQDGRDLHAESIFIGTTLIPVPRHPPASLRVQTVLPLRDMSRPSSARSIPDVERLSRD